MTTDIPDRHVTVVGDKGKAPVFVCEDLRELIRGIRNGEDGEELLIDVSQLCQLVLLHLLQPYPSHYGLSKAKIQIALLTFQ